AHGEVDVALRYVQVPAFRDQGHTDQKQKAECQYLHGGVTVDEPGDGSGGEQHHTDGDHHGRDHHADLVGHSDRSDHGIETEDHVQQQDLDDDRGERRNGDLHLVGFLTFEFLVDLEGGLPQQEQTTEDQDDVTSREFVANHLEQGLREADHPADGEQEQDPHHHRQTETHRPCSRSLRLGQLVGEYGDEDDVVDAEDDLQNCQRDERDPDVGIGEPVHPVTLPGHPVPARQRSIYVNPG